jgi:hypothetical protein
MVYHEIGSWDLKLSILTLHRCFSSVLDPLCSYYGFWGNFVSFFDNIVFSNSPAHVSQHVCSSMCIQDFRNIFLTLPCRIVACWFGLCRFVWLQLAGAILVQTVQTQNLSFMHLYLGNDERWHISSPRFYFAGLRK